MNTELISIYEKEILTVMSTRTRMNQRELARVTGFALGTINKALKNLQNEGYVTETLDTLSKAGKEYMAAHQAKRAVILAAGFGMRMVPINTSIPKGLLRVKGETLIERLIRQLREAGITDITVVVGFMKESYEFLMDDYEVQLVVNGSYAEHNNLHSLQLAASRLEDAYIVPSDMYFFENPFRSQELYSWYMVEEKEDYDSYVKVNRKLELKRTGHNGDHMIGVSYITAADAKDAKELLAKCAADPAYSGAFWEDAFFTKENMTLAARIAPPGMVTEINTYEQLRELDADSSNLNSREISIAAKTLQVGMDDIVNITVLKKGMTNRSFMFEAEEKRYIMRIPGEGTEQLINRREEYEVYQCIRDLKLSDTLCYMNPENGYKITEYIEGARNCDPTSDVDVARAMECLREFHEKKLKVNHVFDLEERLEFYEGLWEGEASCYRDYEATKEGVKKLLDYTAKHHKPYCLCHIDSVADNFMFYEDEKHREHTRLIDWEYAGMQDPDLDIAMFAIYALYDREQTDALVDTYYNRDCPKETRYMIYAYMAIAGLVWSNWCEYKRHLGVEFGEYSLRQYRYAKEYYRIIKNEMGDAWNV